MKRLIAAFLIIMAFFSSVYGINKIRVKDKNWQIYKTEHFRIYYYNGDEFLAKLTAVYAEEAYDHDSAIVNFKPKNAIPLFIYENHDDFTSTNITLSPLSEGTGGFTEPYKNRVVLPNSGSIKQLKQVITHEVAHAIQFAIIYGEGMRNYNVLYKDLFMPVWVMEGLAEYSADDLDSKGEMVLRDAVINNRLMPIDQLDGFSFLEEMYLGYKEAQSIITYIAANYGKDFIPQFIQSVGEEFAVDNVFRKVAKKDYNAFKKEWEYFIKKKYWAQAQGRDNPDKYGPQLTKSQHESPVYDQGPAFSPDGSLIAFISSRGGHRAVWLMRPDGKEAREVFNGFDTISTEGFPISWGTDNKTIYFAVSDRGRRYIVKANIETMAQEKLPIPGMYDIYSPAVSPDDRYVAFTGSNEGFTDVYVFDTATGALDNITNNVFDNNSPNWSPRGNYLVFTEERNGQGRLALYDLKLGKKKFLTEEASYDCAYPRFTDEDTIIFTSDKNGIYNLYSMKLKDKSEKQLTNITTGISAPSYSPDGFVVYSYYEDACYNLYKYLLDRERAFEKLPLVYDESLIAKKSEKSGEAEKKPKPEVVIKAENSNDDAAFKAITEEKAAKVISGSEQYGTMLSPDLLFALFGYESTTGLVGGGYATLSDMTGDNNLALLVNYVPDYYSQFQLSYMYLGLPFDLSFDCYYDQNVYQLYDTEQNVFFSQLESKQYGGGITMTYPLNMYTGVSLFFQTKRVSDRYKNLDTGSTVYFDTTDRDDLLNIAGVSIQYDHSSWRDLAPYSGEEIMIYAESADRIFGGTKTYSIYEADIRKYFDLGFFPGKNLSASFRVLLAMTEGPDRPYFLFGGINSVRGLDYGEMSGDRLALLNAELRYTLVRNMDFKLWPLTFIMVKNIKTVFFDDAGIIKDGPVNSVSNSDIVNGLGFSLLFDTFLFQNQYMPLRLEVARRTDNADGDWKFYFSINTGF